MKNVVLIILIAFVSTSASGQRTTKRDLAAFADGGTFDFSWGVLSEHNAMGERLRKFVWEHWSAKTKARVRIIKYSIEGDPFSRQLFIEPDSKGTWQITSLWESYCCALYHLMKPKPKMVRKRGTSVFLVVDRVQSQTVSQVPFSAKWLVVPVTSELAADKYLLRVKSTETAEDDWIF
ncbi:MAG TPA: hypothetical protein PLL77_15050 [Pyrinomonadaceae bacterium]|nr:hypothetical protein [Pyrinomonadaceae bacterium]